MTISEKLQQELEKVLYGAAWYGTPIYSIIEQVHFETAYEKPGGSVHTIAGIVLHMLSWTEEVMDRMNGMAAQMPSSGDWPDPGTPDEQKWQNYVNDLKLVNVNLLGVIQHFPEDQWAELINDTRDSEPVTTYEELINGFIQHQVYHAGQISILNRIING
ncbi:MAG: DinB family protein [Mucilaginibacter sp.]